MTETDLPRRLREALERYGQHEDGCDAWPQFASHFTGASHIGRCTCGLADALASAGGRGPTCPDCGAANPQRPLDHREGCSEASAGVAPAPPSDGVVMRGIPWGACDCFQRECLICGDGSGEASAPSPVVPRQTAEEENQGLPVSHSAVVNNQPPELGEQ